MQRQRRRPFSIFMTALALVLAAVSPVGLGTAAHAYPTCASASSDPDGDGWGWENNQSCIVGTSTGGGNSSGGYPTCASTSSDPDGDGWGWENNQSCIVGISSGGGGSSGGSGSGTGSSCTGASFQASAVQDGSTWRAFRGSTQVYSGSDMLTAINTAIGSLDSGRSSKQRVVVNGSGTMSANARITLPSYTTLESCGTINVSGSGSGNNAGVYSRGATQVEISRLTMTGTPLYGIFARNVDNLTLGTIDLRLNGSGLGVRIDNLGDTSRYSRNVRIDNVYVSGTGAHGVETYGVDGLTIGTVTARNTGYSGLLLNNTINATIGTVDAANAGSGTGYAAFRMANRNGRINGSYPTNIYVGTVKASGGGRGIFCVSESGGAVIDRIQLSNTGSNSVLIENCYNVSLATSGGTISGGGDFRLAARSEFAGNRDITLQNLTLTNGARIVESPCTSNLTLRNINGSVSRC